MVKPIPQQLQAQTGTCLIWSYFGFLTRLHGISYCDAKRSIRSKKPGLDRNNGHFKISRFVKTIWPISKREPQKIILINLV